MFFKNLPDFFKLDKRHLLLVNCIVWGAPGVKILLVGIRSCLEIWPSGSFVWIVLGAVGVLAAFLWMFSRIVQRYSSRILAFPQQKKSILSFLPPRGWILIIFMMCLGISLKFIPGIPLAFFAFFYPGLGTALIVAAALFLSNWMKAGRLDQ